MYKEAIFVIYGTNDRVICVDSMNLDRYNNGRPFFSTWWPKHKKIVEPEYVPFSFDTFDSKDDLKGRWIRPKHEPLTEYQIIAIKDTSIHIFNQEISYEELLEYYVFDDGTPCGQIKEN